MTHAEAQHSIWAFCETVEVEMLNVGLTGGIACGKSSVAEMFREKGAVVVDFDLLTHRLQEPEQPVWKAIVEAFGKQVLNDDGTLNRSLLGAQVFNDAQKRLLLNSIVHPALFDEWHRMIAAIEQEKTRAIIISDIPLLIEVGKQNAVDIVLLVYSAPEEQVVRLIRRNGYTRQNALERLASQMPIDEKIPYAHIVIDNGGSLEKTRKTVNDVWNDLLLREEKKRLSPRP